MVAAEMPGNRGGESRRFVKPRRQRAQIDSPATTVKRVWIVAIPLAVGSAGIPKTSAQI